jgi:hypothetical protein
VAAQLVASRVVLSSTELVRLFPECVEPKDGIGFVARGAFQRARVAVTTHISDENGMSELRLSRIPSNTRNLLPLETRVVQAVETHTYVSCVVRTLSTYKKVKASP